MIKIAQGSDGWWFDGARFYEKGDGIPLTSADPAARDLLEALCVRLFFLNRWQGEPSLYGPVSVGYHSLLVAELAARLARVRGLDAEACRRAGAAHDLGEALGLGDIAAPWLRGCIDLRALNERHQRAAERLLSIEKGWHFGDPEIWLVVKDADHLAAGIERRYLYGDDSRDMEGRDVERLLAELGLDRINVDNSTAKGAALFEARGGQCLVTPLDGPSQLVATCGC